MALALPGGVDPDPARQQKFDRLALAMPGFGGQSVEVRFGTATLTWANAASLSAALAVSHGLGRTPVTVVATANGTGGPSIVLCHAFSLGATTFTVQGGFLTGTATGVTTVTFGWIAIG